MAELKNLMDPAIAERMQEMLITYGLPVTMAGIRARNLKQREKDANVNLVSPQLNTGVVRDMQRPSFALPSRVPMGSSLAEQIAGQKFADAFQRDQEIKFSAANEASKISQEEGIRMRENEQAVQTANIQNMEEQMNTQTNLRQLLMDRQSIDEMLAGIYSSANTEFVQQKAADISSRGRDFYSKVKAGESEENLKKLYPEFF